MRNTFFESKIGIAFVVFVLSASVMTYLERMPRIVAAITTFFGNVPEILAAIVAFFRGNEEGNEAGLIAFAALILSLSVAWYNRKLNHGIHLLQLKNAFWEKERHKVHKRIISRYNDRDFFTGEGTQKRTRRKTRTFR